MRFDDTLQKQTDWRRKIQCESLLPNGNRCNRNAMEGKNLCRWHHIIDQCCANAKGWHRPIAILMAIIGFNFILTGTSSIFSFLTNLSLPSLGRGVFLLLLADYFLSLSAIYWGFRYPTVCITLAIGLFGMGVSLLILLIISTIALPFGNQILAEYAGNTPYPTFLVIIGIWGFFCLFQFASVIMMANISRRLYFIFVSIFFLALIANAFFSGNKFLSLIFIIIPAGYILDVNFGWTKQLRKW